MHSHITFSAAAKGGLVNMNRKSLSTQVAALAVNKLRGLFDEIADAIGKKRFYSNGMHETGLMKHIVNLSHV